MNSAHYKKLITHFYYFIIAIFPFILIIGLHHEAYFYRYIRTFDSAAELFQKKFQ